MRVLIVYENIPESTDMFIVDAHGQELEDLRMAHGNYVNAIDNEETEKAMARISLRLGSKESDNAKIREWCGLEESDVAMWEFTGLTNPEPISVPDSEIDMVIVTGFVC